MDILNQLGDLFLSAVPTVIIVFLFYFFLRWSFFKPIERVLAERHSRAEGARQEAEISRAAVQEKLRTYNDALKKARTELFVEQEAARRRVLDERQTRISAARVAAQKSLQDAKKAIAADMETARVELEQTSGALATEIADSIIAGRSSGPGATPSGGAR
jgi:F0F1-type ATP synthase membrane subunit b/b'